MNLISLKANFYDFKPFPLISRFVSLFCFVFCFFCHGTNTNPFQFCDNFNDRLDCTEPKTENDLVLLDRSKWKKDNPNYEDFGNYLYFTARETPGFRLVLSKPWNGVGSDAFKNQYIAYLQYGNSKERMEGNQFNPNAVVSFHYLGALLKEEFRHLGIDSKPFQLEALGPISLNYLVNVPGMEPISKQRTIHLQWKP
ncbi:hypothetical protein [Leptospira biflexa]|uniref:hypothetical protein n=1 Tax=Leptospira biflexa TaxID=172 RepID=UPI001D0599D5|nr:hypothetical protein [Leptospira biflexa]